MKIRRLVVLAIMVGSLPLLSVPTQAAENVKIGIAYDTGGLGDHSFNDAVAVGLNVAKKNYSFQVIATVTVGSESDRVLRLNSLIAKGSKYILAVGNSYASALGKVALENPQLQFGIVDNVSIRLLNVSSLVFNEKQGGYLAGVAAALASKSNKIAIIGDTSQSRDYEMGFLAGAKSVKKGITIFPRSESGGFGEVAKGVLTAGTDVIFISFSGSASDVVAAVEMRNKGSIVKLIGIEPDQYVWLTPSAKKYFIASIVKRVDKAVVDFVSSAQVDFPLTDILDPTAGIYGRRFGIAEDGVEISLRTNSLKKFSKEMNAGIVRAQAPSFAK